LKNNTDNLTDEETIEFIRDSLQFLKKDFNLRNFFLELKRNGHSALKHLSFVAPHVRANKKTKKQYKKELIQRIVQLELADTLFRSGATAHEVIRETKVPEVILAALLRSYYKELPASLLQFKLMQYRLFQLVQQNKLFLEKYVLPDLQKHGKAMANGLLSTMLDVVLGNAEDRVFLDSLANSINEQEK